MKRGASRHPKLAHLCRELGTTRRDAVGLLELLWEYTGEYAPKGDIGRFTDSDIANAVDWKGNAGELIEGLVAAGWLDRCTENGLVVHDWEDHAPDYIRKRLARQKTAFLHAQTPPADNGGQRRPWVAPTSACLL